MKNTFLIDKKILLYKLLTCCWIVQISEFVKLGGDQLVPYYADILGAILPCISDKEEKIRVVGLFIFSCFIFCFNLGCCVLSAIYAENLVHGFYLFFLKTCNSRSLFISTGCS